MRRRPNRNAYNAALLDARRTGYALTRQGVYRIKRAFEDAARELRKSGAQPDWYSRPLLEARARDMRQELVMMLDMLEGKINGATRTSIIKTVTDVTDIHRDVVRNILKNDLTQRTSAQLVAQAFSHVPVRAVAVMNARRQNAATFQTLVNRSKLDAVPELDRILSQAVATGKSPAELTKDIARLLGGNDPASLGDYGLESKDVSGLRTLFYDARRIAVTETNNALREANTQALVASPVIAATWQRSGRHAAIGDEDECDELAAADDYGYGPGMFPVDDWPLAPHPHCGCTQGGPVIFGDLDQWVQGVDTTGLAAEELESE